MFFGFGRKKRRRKHVAKRPLSYYSVWEEVPPQDNPRWEDQRHINQAHVLYRLFMAELLQLHSTDAVLDRIRRTMYVVEDTLSEYAKPIPHGHEAK